FPGQIVCIARDLLRVKRRIKRILQGRVVRSLDFESIVLDPPRTAEKASRWWSRRPSTVGIIDAAVARAHEQPGLWKPRDRAAKVRAVHGKDQESRTALLIAAFITDIDARIRDHAIPGLAQRIVERNQTGFAFGKILRGPERN